MPKSSYRVSSRDRRSDQRLRPAVVRRSPRVLPVYRSSTYVFSSPEAAERAFAIALGKSPALADESPDLIYARLNHPNAEILEDHLVPPLSNPEPPAPPYSIVAWPRFIPFLWASSNATVRCSIRNPCMAVRSI